MRLLGIPLTLGLALATSAPAFAERTAPPEGGGPTLIDLVASSGAIFDQNPFDYDALYMALLSTNLDDALADPLADLTLFAPNDLAFIRLARDLGYTGHDEADAWNFLVQTLTVLGNGDAIPLLTDVLLYHVAPESLAPLQVVFAGEIPTLLPGAVIRPLFLRLRDGEPDLHDARLFLPLNVPASNGVLHTVNRVLLPFDLP